MSVQGLYPSMWTVLSLLQELHAFFLLLCMLCVASVRGIMKGPWFKGMICMLDTPCDEVQASPQGLDDVGMFQIGGGRRPQLTYQIIKPYLEGHFAWAAPHMTFNFVDHVAPALQSMHNRDLYLLINMPLHELVKCIPVSTGRKVAALHGVQLGSRATLATLHKVMQEHVCNDCPAFITVLSVENKGTVLYGMSQRQASEANGDQLPAALPSVFPPLPLTLTQKHQIIESACKAMDKGHIEERGCAVCGQLTQLTDLSPLSAMKNHLHLLACVGVSRLERRCATDHIVLLQCSRLQRFTGRLHCSVLDGSPDPARNFTGLAATAGLPRQQPDLY